MMETETKTTAVKKRKPKKPHPILDAPSVQWHADDLVRWKGYRFTWRWKLEDRDNARHVYVQVPGRGEMRFGYLDKHLMQEPVNGFGMFRQGTGIGDRALVAMYEID